ncbi:MAG TPA: DUF6603 domain-containing protein [Pyrinomonadaceae bacterium]|jgi:hypothetical protein
MAERDTIAVLAEELARALQPLTAAFTSPDALRDFLEELGWDFAAAPAALDSLRAPVEQAFALVDGTESITGAKIGQLLDSVRSVFQGISNLQSAGGLANDFRNEFPPQLTEYLIVEYMLKQQARWGYLLMALGIIRLESRPAQGARPAHLRRIFAFSDFANLLQNPLAFFKNSYQWGQSGFAGERLYQSLFGLFDASPLHVREQLLDAQTLNQLNSGALLPQQALEASLRLVLIEDSLDPSLFGAGVGLFLLPETAADKPGFALLPYASAGFTEEIEISEDITLGFEGGIDLTGGAGILVRPNRDVEFKLGFASGAPGAASGNLGVILRLGQPGTPIVIVGTPGASRLEFGGISVEGGTRFSGEGKFEVFTEFELKAGKIVIKPSAEERDGFLSKLLPGDGLEIKFDLVVGFSTTQGLYFGGSGGLELSLPAHIQLGPVEIESAMLAVRVKDGGIPVELTATIKGDLSVLKAVVENIGMTATFTFPGDGKGNLGPVNLGLGFRPPNGVGLLVDAGVIKGGGYLYLDFAKGEYAGALELTFSGFLSLKAIGIINTKLPGGQPGFSLLIIITAEFSPGFQLGYGFTLLGVGGLLGLNRGMSLEPLVQGVRTGAVNSILFPTNVIENAPRIISDLRTIFPPDEGTFLIGPMAKLGWGTPTLINLSLGIIIEIPGNIVILGRLRLNLPAEEAPLIVIQVTFIGAIEFDKRRIWFFASLYESRMLFLTLDGDMGLLMDFSDTPNFVLSVGGFHPRYQAPALPFPSPTRITVSIINESFARIRFESYFAVTSNSVQFGTRSEMFFGFDSLNVEGYTTFDALFQFSPFHFIVEISTGFSVKVFGLGLFGVHLRGSLEGPEPWRIRGSASISLLFFDIDVDVDVTFGDRSNDTLPPIDVMPIITGEFNKNENWQATLPPSGQLLVSLRDLGEQAALILHPVGTLRISQRAVPINLKIDKIGNQKVSDINQLALGVQTNGLTLKETRREFFARAQYQEMDDAQKLSKPSFERLDSGVEIAAESKQWATGPASQRNVRYETIIIDTLFERFRIRFFKFWGGLFAHFSAGAAVSKSPLSLASERQLQPFAAKVAIAGDHYAVAWAADNKTYTTTSVFLSHAEAEQHLNEAISKNPALAETIHVIPTMEVNQAA